MSTDLRELALRHRVQQTACKSAEDTRRFVTFALACVQSTPLSNGLPLAALFQGRRRLEEAVGIVNRWLVGEVVTERLGEIHDAVFEAVNETGPFVAWMTGERAAFWAVYQLHKAVSIAVKSDLDETELGEVAAAAGMAAYLARHASDEGVSLAAVEFQERLFARMFGG